MTLPIYQAGQAESYVQGKGWKYKRSGDQLVLETCPLCNKGGFKFYISDSKGAWDCKYGSCARKGNYYQLLKEFGDAALVKRTSTQDAAPKRRRYTLEDMLTFEMALSIDEEAQAYLTSRGLKKETWQAWHLGVKTDRDGIKWLLIPYINGNQITDVKYRTLPPHERRFQRLGGGESILYGQHLLAEHKRDKERKLYLVEGEIDALTLWQQGFAPVLSTTTGAGSFKSEWYDAIESYDPEQIVICYDSDVAGQKGADAHLKKFEEDNRTCLNVVLPDVKDANEYFLTHTKEDFEALISEAGEREIEGCYSMATVLDRLEEQLWHSSDAFDGIPSVFSDVNAMVAGGYWNGQLVVLSGISGTGKTSFVLQEQVAMAKRGIPNFMMCLEMPEIMLQRKIIEKEYGIPLLKIQQEHVQKFRPELAKLPFYMGNKGTNLDTVERIIRAAVKRYDLKCISFDNINYFVRSIEHQTQEIARVTKRLKELAIDLHIPIIAIAQPRKFDDETRMMTMNDLKDSSAIMNDSDSIILLYRKRIKTDIRDMSQAAAFMGNQSPYTLVRVEKARYAAGGECYLYFDGSRSTYRELAPGESQNMQQQ
jgi:replicative DNA helicase